MTQDFYITVSIAVFTPLIFTCLMLYKRYQYLKTKGGEQ